MSEGNVARAIVYRNKRDITESLSSQTEEGQIFSEAKPAGLHPGYSKIIVYEQPLICSTCPIIITPTKPLVVFAEPLVKIPTVSLVSRELVYR